VNGWKRSAAGLLLLLLVLAACSGPGSTAARGIAEGNLARDFTLQTIDGHSVSLSDYEGNVVLVNFWATWCPPCQAEIPALQQAYETHKDEGFVVLGINDDESEAAVRPFVQGMGMTYPILLDGNGRLLQEYRAQGLPMSIFLDRKGTIKVRHIGYLSAEQLDKYLADLLP
jgi:cytochrome c biogenesis protein CcmG/thiol:disulfide interchange protein DsbE